MQIARCILSVCMGAFAVITTYAQGPCINQEFPYEFCDGHRIIRKCSADPHREPGLKPLRVQEPPCMIPAKTYDLAMTISASPGPSVVEVFNPDQAIRDLNDAWNEWVSLCPNTAGGSPPSGFCCLKIWMSRNVFDFRQATADISTEVNYTADVHLTCRKDCDAPNIFMNFTDDFLWQDRDIVTEPQAIVYFTGTRSPFSDYYNLSCDDVISFKQHIQERMGEHLGLGSIDVGLPCGDPDALMNNPTVAHDATGLTASDKCQYQKLYCPDAVGLDPALSVDEAIANQGVSLDANTPNPFSELTTIPYSVAKRGSVRLTIIDVVGKEVAVLVDQQMEPGNYTVGFHATADMPAGTYWYALDLNGRTLARKMIYVR
jgi:hypothetical protein